MALPPLGCHLIASSERLKKTDKSQSTYGTACSIPDIGSNLTGNNVATISMTAAPASGQKLTVATGGLLATHLAIHARSETKL